VEATVAVLGALDLQGVELRFLRDRIRAEGCATIVVDVGTSRPPLFPPTIDRQEVAAAAGADLSQLSFSGKHDEVVAALAQGAAKLLSERFREGAVHALVALGGYDETAIGIAAMRALPMGVPKLMVSTHSSTGTGRFAGTRDVLLMTAMVDFVGLEQISAEVLANAAAAIAGMVSRPTVVMGRAPD
jgi:uncharacterized protein (UPF0261 family)